MSAPSAEIIAEAESFPGIKAGIARLADVLWAPSYQVVPEGEFASSVSEEAAAAQWPAEARSLLVLGLHHPEDDPRLDWWHGGSSPGDRRLVEICESLRDWLSEELGVRALPLPYTVERGGVFLKDAAVLAGLGIIGRSNLVVTPEWGPRVRFRALLIAGNLEATGPLEGFAPCDVCAQLCHLACPRDVFSTGVFHRPTCIQQIDADVANERPDGTADQDGSPRLVIAYCRACELACPEGA